MIQRDIDLLMLDWKQSRFRKPLLIRGARQVGKTSSIRRFGEQEYRNCVILNFEEQAEFIHCFDSLNVTEILEKITILSGSEIHSEKTLLFLDEIQECPRAITALRYFYEKRPDLHVIGAGSLLEFTLNSHDFKMPVGRIMSLNMEPLSFFEFLNNKTWTGLRHYLSNLDIQSGIDPVISKKIDTIWRKYLVTGGMPEVVSACFASASPGELKVIQTGILQTFRTDFAKYAATSQHKYLRDVFTSAPRMIGRQCKYSHINPHVQSRDLRHAIDLLSQAKCIHKLTHSSGNGVPLEAQINPKKFKLFFLDVGLAQRALGLETQLMFEDEILTVNSGSIAEQYVGQQLLSAMDAYDDKRLHYWARESRSSQAEIDFLATIDDKVIPVEVKSGKTGTLKSMHIFLDEHPASPFGIRFSQHELSWHDRILSIPLYLARDWKRLAQQILD